MSRNRNNSEACVVCRRRVRQEEMLNLGGHPVHGYHRTSTTIKAGWIPQIVWPAQQRDTADELTRLAEEMGLYD